MMKSIALKPRCHRVCSRIGAICPPGSGQATIARANSRQTGYIHSRNGMKRQRLHMEYGFPRNCNPAMQTLFLR